MVDAKPIPEGWNTSAIGGVVRERKERAGDRSFEVLSCSKIHGIIRQSEKFKRRVASKQIDRYKAVHPGEFVYDPMLLWDGSIGRNNYDFPGVVSPVYSVFAATEDVDSDFMELLLKSRRMRPYYVQISEGTNRRRRKARFSSFEALEILLPPLPEQWAIARVLRTVQEAIEATERVIEAAKELKRSMMEYLFTYGPVPVDQADQVELQDAEFRQMPQHWESYKLGAVARIVSGGTPSRKDPSFWEGGTIPWVKTAEVAYDTILDTGERITEQGLSNSSARMIPAGTLLVAMYGQGITRGRAAILGIDAAVNQACAAILPDIPLSAEYLQAFFEHNYEQIRNLGHGAHQKNLSAALLKSVQLPVPDEEVQRQLAAQLGAISTSTGAFQKRRLALDELFSSLLHNLMTGKVRVAPTDQDMEASE